MPLPPLALDPKTGLRYRPGTLDRYLIGELGSYAELLPSPGDVILDVGACLGSVTAWARSRGARVIAVEPHPENFELLMLNAPQPIDDNVWAACVSDRTVETVTLYAAVGKNYGLHSTAPHRGRTEISVPAIYFSDLIRAERVTKLKVDCEGAEYDLLLSRLPSLVTRIVMEYHLTKQEWRKNGPKLHAWLGRQGFRAIREPRFGEKNWTTMGAYAR